MTLKETKKAVAVAPAKKEARVYCGPEIRGVAHSFQSFLGELPEGLKELCAKNKIAEALVVPFSQMPEAWKSIHSGEGKYAALYKELLKK